MPTQLASIIALLSLSFARIGLGIWLFSAPLPLRNGAWRRIPLTILALFSLYILVLLGTMTALPAQKGLHFAFAQFFTYSVLLIACVGGLHVIYDTGIWTALFCCSAGYTIQNLASGIVELFWALLSDPGNLSLLRSQQRLIVSFVCTATIYVVTYMLITRRLESSSLQLIDDRAMLLMMVAVIIVIIGFDLVIKWLVEQGVATAAMVLLRMFHGLACVYTITIEFEMLYAQHVEAQRDVAWQVLAERERQYEASRANVEAINARVHDIRHAVGRLADEAQVDRSVLADIVREVDVYGGSLHTGCAPLDTVLAEKSLPCQQADIALTCVADGHALDFMAPGDVYVLFSALLDEAIARTSALEEGRSVSVVVREALGATSIHVECSSGLSTSTDTKETETAHVLCESYDAVLTSFEEEGTWHANALFVQS